MTDPKQTYALLGWPVKHSLSPPMQEAGLRAAGLPGAYVLLEVHPDGLPDCFARLRDAGCPGWNCTVPHKQQALALVDRVDAGARATGTVNTVVNRQGVLVGYSTDGYGLATALKESFGLDVEGQRIAFLGAGGAARAASLYLAHRGVGELVLVNRTRSRAEALAADVRELQPACDVAVCVPTDADALLHLLPTCSVVVQATSAGLHPGDPMAVDPDLLPPGVPFMDMIYRGTPLLKAARAAGCPCADGRGMLLHQGVRSFELWTGVQPGPVAAMRAALEQALRERDNASR